MEALADEGETNQPWLSARVRHVDVLCNIRHGPCSVHSARAVGTRPYVVGVRYTWM